MMYFLLKPLMLNANKSRFQQNCFAQSIYESPTSIRRYYFRSLYYYVFVFQATHEILKLSSEYQALLFSNKLVSSRYLLFKCWTLLAISETQINLYLPQTPSFLQQGHPSFQFFIIPPFSRPFFRPKSTNLQISINNQEFHLTQNIKHFYIRQQHSSFLQLCHQL